MIPTEHSVKDMISRAPLKATPAVRETYATCHPQYRRSMERLAATWQLTEGDMNLVLMHLEAEQKRLRELGLL